MTITTAFSKLLRRGHPKPANEPPLVAPEPSAGAALAPAMERLGLQPGDVVRVRVGLKVVSVPVIRVNAHSFWVRLPDGSEIKRKKARDLVGVGDA